MKIGGAPSSERPNEKLYAPGAVGSVMPRFRGTLVATSIVSGSGPLPAYGAPGPSSWPDDIWRAESTVPGPAEDSKATCRYSAAKYAPPQPETEPEREYTPLQGFH